MPYKEQTFALPSLSGISDESIKQHLALYAGYVKNFNAISALMPQYARDGEKHGLALSEIIRRRSFEFDGMRLHELYFSQFEGGATAPAADGALAKAFEKDYHSLDNLVGMMKGVAGMRGPGWALLYWDQKGGQFFCNFVGEQHQGHFATLPIILALDVWEHAYLLDYGAAGKAKYVDAFFANLNWSVCEQRFAALVK
jgi:Fe-Mn family superoxide dismutase